MLTDLHMLTVQAIEKVPRTIVQDKKLEKRLFTIYKHKHQKNRS